MNLSRYRNDYYDNAQRCTTISQPLPKSHSMPAWVFRTDRRSSPATRSCFVNDAILKCLHRDDPLRHTYLRRRWQTS